MIITKETAVLCAEFMLDEDWDTIVIPYSVGRALRDLELNPHNMNLQWALAHALQHWYEVDREACMALLGPGLEP